VISYPNSTKVFAKKNPKDLFDKQKISENYKDKISIFRNQNNKGLSNPKLRKLDYDNFDQFARSATSPNNLNNANNN
jgi:hypothetical protein